MGLEITEVRVKLMPDEGDDKLRAFCSVTFNDEFVVRDLKIIQGQYGPFVAMPSRKLTSRCLHCRTKNHLRSKFCNECGQSLPQDLSRRKDGDGRLNLHADIAHPINQACRRKIERRVLRHFDEELDRSKRPGYQFASTEEDELSQPYRERAMEAAADSFDEGAKGSPNQRKPEPPTDKDDWI